MTNHILRAMQILRNHGIQILIENGIAYAGDTYTLNGELITDWVDIDGLNLREFLNY